MNARISHIAALKGFSILPPKSRALSCLMKDSILSRKAKAIQAFPFQYPAAAPAPATAKEIHSATSVADPYRILQIARPIQGDIQTCLQQARASFVRLAFKCHPDQGGNAQEFMRVQQAWLTIQQDLQNSDKKSPSSSMTAQSTNLYPAPPPIPGMFEPSFSYEDLKEMLDLYHSMSQMGKLRGWEVELHGWFNYINKMNTDRVPQTHQLDTGDKRHTKIVNLSHRRRKSVR
jgi:hypothetical protein